MQILDDRRQVNSASDAKFPTRDNSTSYSKLGIGASFDLFAEIFQAIAVSLSPEPAAKEVPDASEPIAGSEKISESEPDVTETDDEAVLVELASFGLPVPLQPKLSDERIAPVADELAIDADVSTGDVGAIVADVEAIAADADAHASTSKVVVEPALVVGTAAKPDDKPIEVVAHKTDDKTEAVTQDQGQAVDALQLVNSHTSEAESTTLDKNLKVAVQEISTAPPATDVVVPESVAATTQSNALPDTAALVASEEVDSSSKGRRERKSRSSDSENRITAAERNHTANESRNETVERSAVISATETRDGSSANGTAQGQTNKNEFDRAVQPLATTVTANSIGATSLSAAQTAISPVTVKGAPGSVDSPGIGGLSPTSARAADSTKTADSAANRQTEVADRARLVHRIAKAFQRLSVDGGNVRLKMHPDELGGVQLDMHVSGRTVNAKVIAESESARQLLQDSLPELRQRLESQGLIVQRLEVERRTDGGNAWLTQQGQQQTEGNFGNESSRRDSSQRRQNNLLAVENKATVSAAAPRRSTMAAAYDRTIDLRV